MSKKITITIVPKEVGQVIDELLQSIFKQFSSEQITPQGSDLTKLIPYHYYSSYDLFQGQCYQQYLSNTCGYHATFNTLCCLKLFSQLYSGIDYHIQSRVSFWRFKLKIQKFLIQYKHKNKLRDQWPWKMQDILNGDFQRTYNQVCISKLDDFAIFRQHPDFQLITHTWQFQYQNLIGSYDSKKELQKKIDYYLNYSKKKPLVFSLMLAITTHWTCFLAFKVDGKNQFWYFDSFNNKTLDYTHEEILEFIQMKNKERIQYKKPQMTPFQKQSYTQCQIDIQISLKLIIDLLKGKTSLRAYEYNRMFEIFADPLQKALKESQQNFFTTLKDYKHNIRSFYNIPFEKNLLSIHNKRRSQEFLTASALLSKKNSEAHLFWSYLDRCRL